MKILCDVCNKDNASLFCTADEAALCDACDHQVHHANKLAGKHRRFSLLHPSSPKQIPVCDICKERRAFLFCHQHKQILCRECDAPLHKTNEHTQKHFRFLLTGVKLSATSALYSPSSSSAVPSFNSQSSMNTVSTSSSPLVPSFNSQSSMNTVSNTQTIDKGVDSNNQCTSSISEYLMETLPGWGVEDFLDHCPSSVFSQVIDADLPIWDDNLSSNMSSFSTQRNTNYTSDWVPQAPNHTNFYQYPSLNMGYANEMVPKEFKEAPNNGRWWREDVCLSVPQINFAPNTASKRSRTFRN